MIHVSVTVNGPGVTSLTCAVTKAIRNITPPKTYKCQYCETVYYNEHDKYADAYQAKDLQTNPVSYKMGTRSLSWG
jgi:hypothetical protein